MNEPPKFWAYVRAITENVGYTIRGKGQIKIPSVSEMGQALEALGLDVSKVIGERHRPIGLGRKLRAYFKHRAHVLNGFVEPRLMDVTRARRLFRKLRAELSPKCPLPMNKQKGKKRSQAYFTGIINMLIEANCKGFPCDYDPRRLTMVVAEGVPIRTLARRVDGAFPGPVNPIAVWEIKEYYYTTTFGSRVADGVYESLLDGMELMDIRRDEGVHIRHYLMVDAHYTWWDCGRSYLCRIVDMLHMGYVDEVLFGREVIEALPRIARTWVRLLRKRGGHRRRQSRS